MANLDILKGICFLAGFPQLSKSELFLILICPRIRLIVHEGS